MKTWYNEIEPYAAEWLRNLMAGGLIAPGEVDERSIEDVAPVDLSGYDRCHFFAGIAGWEKALQLAGWPESWPVWTGSCPCQPFSSAGKGGRGLDERHLWPAWFHLIRVCRPPIIFGEQVASKDGLKWLDLVCTDLEAAGYAVGAADLCAAGVGAPHIRQRLWFVAYAESFRPASALHDKEILLPVTGGNPAILLGHAAVSGSGFGLCDSGQGEKRGTEFADASAIISLGQPENRGCEGNLLHKIQGRWDRERSVTDAARPSPTGELADAEGLRWGVWDSDDQWQTDGEVNTPSNNSENFWSSCQWLPCRDGRWRPTKPSLSPLAHGVSGRVGKLRAIGNSIVPQVAAEFIRAVMEVIK